MKPNLPKYTCLCCGTSYEVGAGSYPIRSVKAWADANICDNCRSANWDGIVPTTYFRLRAHLAKHGIVPAENEKGWWDIPQ